MKTYHLSDLYNMFLRGLPKITVLIDPLLVLLMNTSGKSLHKMCVKFYHGIEIYKCFFRPYNNNCHYCYVKYDVIGHLEDSFEDTMYIAMKQNLTTLLPELTKTNRKTKGKKSSQDRIEHYMSQLNTNLKRKLYELYQLDFELFGYDPGDTMCKNEACIE